MGSVVELVRCGERANAPSHRDDLRGLWRLDEAQLAPALSDPASAARACVLSDRPGSRGSWSVRGVEKGAAMTGQPRVAASPGVSMEAADWDGFVQLSEAVGSVVMRLAFQQPAPQCELSK